MSDVMDLPLVALAKRLGDDSLSPKAVTEVCLRRIKRLDPILGAFAGLDEDGARCQAAAACNRRERRTRPLDGVPVAVKENIDVAGLVTRNGLGPRTEKPAYRDADIVARLREAGAVILGHLAMDEAALGGTAENPHGRRVENPWRPGFTPGGSSSGPAVAVAARLCPLALGTDTLGSLLLPAAYCGVVGFRPSHGWLDNAGIEPLAKHLDQVGPLTRTIGDLMLMLDGLGCLAKPKRLRDLSLLRIGRLAEFDYVPFDDDVRRAFENACHRLTQAGVGLQEVHLPGYDPGRAARAGWLVTEAEAAASHVTDRDTYAAAFSGALKARLDRGAGATAGQLHEAATLIDDVRGCYDSLFDSIDLLIAPTAPQSAFAFEADRPANQMDLTALASLARAPAISLPIPSADLPVGLQVMGRRGADDRLLDAAYLMEEELSFKGMDLPLDELI